MEQVDVIKQSVVTGQAERIHDRTGTTDGRRTRRRTGTTNGNDLSADTFAADKVSGGEDFEEDDERDDDRVTYETGEPDAFRTPEGLYLIWGKGSRN